METLVIHCGLDLLEEIRHDLAEFPLVKNVVLFDWRAEYNNVLFNWLKTNMICRSLSLCMEARHSIGDFFDQLSQVCVNLEELIITSKDDNLFLTKVLAVNPNLKRLDIHRGHINPENVSLIASKIRNGVLTELYLPDCVMTDDSMHCILKEMDKLEALDISGTGANPDFLPFFILNKSLKFLDISNNRFSHGTMIALCCDVALHSSLKYFVAKGILDIPGARDCALSLVDNTRLLKISGFHCQAKTLTKRNKAAFDLCRSSSLCVAWCKHWLGRDVMRLIAQYLWATRGTRVWIREGGDTSSPNPKKRKVLK